SAISIPVAAAFAALAVVVLAAIPPAAAFRALVAACRPLSGFASFAAPGPSAILAPVAIPLTDAVPVAAPVAAQGIVPILPRIPETIPGATSLRGEPGSRDPTVFVAADAPLSQ